jgi:hypothetical protein
MRPVRAPNALAIAAFCIVARANTPNLVYMKVI